MRASLERALEEIRHDVLHAVRLDLGEGPVLPRESGLGKAATHDRRDASLGREPGRLAGNCQESVYPRLLLGSHGPRQATCQLGMSSGQGLRAVALSAVYPRFSAPNYEFCA